MPTAVIVRELGHHGLLLQQDKRFPSVVQLVTGEALTTSWWGHPKARLVFATLGELAEHPEVLFTKLLFGKVTLVHRRLWSVFYAVATSSEAWQVRGLPDSSRKLLLAIYEGQRMEAAGPVVKELEKRLLANALQVHTRSGRHAFVLESWRAWANRVHVRAEATVPVARKILEEATAKVGVPLQALPWVAAERALKNSR